MPSLFPELFNFSFIAPFILRIALGVAIAISGSGNFTRENKISQKIFGGIIFLSGIFLIIGLFTQAVLLAVSLIIIIDSIITYNRSGKILPEVFIKIAVIISLILTGPGIFALDLPL